MQHETDYSVWHGNLLHGAGVCRETRKRFVQIHRALGWKGRLNLRRKNQVRLAKEMDDYYSRDGYKGD